MELASILSPCLFWGKHNVAAFHFAVGKEVVNSDKSPLYFPLWRPGVVEVKLWISRKELQAALRGLNHCLGNGVLHALVPFPRWCMDIRSAQLYANSSPVIVLLADRCWCAVECGPFLVHFSFYTVGNTPHSLQISDWETKPNSSNASCSVWQLRYTFLGSLFLGQNA